RFGGRRRTSAPCPRVAPAIRDHRSRGSYVPPARGNEIAPFSTSVNEPIGAEILDQPHTDAKRPIAVHEILARKAEGDATLGKRAGARIRYPWCAEHPLLGNGSGWRSLSA